MDILIKFLGTTGFANLTVGNIAMIAIGITFITLAIRKHYEPLLLVPIGFGIIVGNIPVIEAMALSVYHQGGIVVQDGEVQTEAKDIESVDGGRKHQVTVTLMELPPGCSGASDADYYCGVLRQILDAGIPFDAVCFKDASGTAVPSKVHETIKRAHKMLPGDAFIHFHTHEPAGISVQTYMAALDAGADAIDLSMAPCSGGTCQPDILVMWHVLRGTEYTLDIDIDKVREAEEVFNDGMKDYFLPPEATAVEPLIPWSPMPGGALTANTQMMRDNGIMDKCPDLIKAMSDVVRRGGFGTSVTPVSQFYVQQALNNVMFGPWTKIAEPYGKMVLRYFGKTPIAPDPEIVRIASEQLDLPPTTRPVLEMNDEDPTKGVASARAVLNENNLAETNENLFIIATCKDKGLAFLKGEATVGVRKIEAEKEPMTAATTRPAACPRNYTVTVDDKNYSMTIDGTTATVNGKVCQVGLTEQPSIAGAAATTAGEETEVKAQMPGVILRIVANVGVQVNSGDSIMVLEAMKMEVQVAAPKAGTIKEVGVAPGDQVGNGQVLARIG